MRHVPRFSLLAAALLLATSGATDNEAPSPAKDDEPEPAREETLVRFREVAEEALRRSNGNPESLGIPLRHFIHPKGYALAFDLMAICAELTGEALDERGVWPRGAKGELWLPSVLATRAA